ncbi:MAG: glycosyltransferase [Methylocella sp.]
MRVWTFIAANEGFARRTINYLSYAASATLATIWLERPDVVVSTSPQFFCGLTGLIAKTMKRTPWVLEIRDLWPESIVTVGAMRKGLVVRLLERFEALAYRRADRIVSVTESFVPHIVARGGADAKISVIKNGADLDFFTPANDGRDVKRRLGLEGRFVAAYVGTHGMAHGLDTILEAADHLREVYRIVFLFVGDGADRQRLARRKHEMRLDNVVMLGQQPKEAMPGIWAATDASLILLRRDDLFKTVLPSKMFEAMAMRRPIILGVEGEARALLDGAGAGIGITPESAEELAAAVTRLADDSELGARLGASGCAHVRMHHDRKARDALSRHDRGHRCGGQVSARPGRGVVQDGCRPVNGGGPIQKMARAIVFGRHIPITRLARRIKLGVKRRVKQHTGTAAPRSLVAPPLSGRPLPLFEPRRGKFVRHGDQWRFTFLHRFRQMTGAVDWRAGGEGPENQLWRMNLHYMEYLEEADDGLFADLVRQWIDVNPPFERGFWKDSWNSYTVSLRAAVWMQQLAVRGTGPDSNARATMLVSLAEQLNYLEENLETDIGGNHLIKNIKGLLWASAFFAGPDATRWRAKGLKLLARELPRQILARILVQRQLREETLRFALRLGDARGRGRNSRYRAKARSDR